VSAAGARATVPRMPDEAEFPATRVPSIRRVMTPQDTNLMGTVFGGAILSEIDLAAAIEAHKLHAGNVVTVAMDKVEFKQPIFVGDLVTLFTDVVRVGRTSITVRVTVWAQRRAPPRDTVPVTEALVTMVAVDESLQPVPVGHAGALRADGGPGGGAR
jgi:acyl-CoA thioesterase YciA